MAPHLTTDPGLALERSHTTMADLDLLLAESDREDPILAPPRGGTPLELDEAIDAQILAGLVSP